MKKLLLDTFAALFNLGKALNAPSRLQSEATKAKKELEIAKERLSETQKRSQFLELKKHYDSQVTLASYGYTRFMILCDGVVMSAHTTFEYAMIAFQYLNNFNSPVKVIFENENGQVEDFTEYFIL
jgi:hypothetical protein